MPYNCALVVGPPAATKYLTTQRSRRGRSSEVTPTVSSRSSISQPAAHTRQRLAQVIERPWPRRSVSNAHRARFSERRTPWPSSPSFHRSFPDQAKTYRLQKFRLQRIRHLHPPFRQSSDLILGGRRAAASARRVK